MSLLFGLPWRGVGVAIAIIVVGLVYAELKRVGNLESQLEAATEIANVNAEIADQERQFRAQAGQTAARAAAEAQRARRYYLDQRRKVGDAKSEEDGPIAPVLRRVLDGLPEPAQSAAAHPDSPRSAE